MDNGTKNTTNNTNTNGYSDYGRQVERRRRLEAYWVSYMKSHNIQMKGTTCNSEVHV